MTGSSSRMVLTGSRVEALARQFLESDYSSDQYSNWPLDRRLEGFLQHSHLRHVADNGDLFNLILDRAMAGVHQCGAVPWRPDGALSTGPSSRASAVAPSR